ncbi:MAG: DUF4149 domain-containing protein [Candidatus Hydrothermarchaeales archaeon]
MAVNVLMVLLSWIHVLAVVVWLGGGIFFTFLVVPKLSVLSPPDAGKVSGGIAKQFTPLVWVSAVVLAVTGLIRMYLMGKLSISALLSDSYGNTLLLKLLIFVVIVIVAALITTTGQKLGNASSPEEAGALAKRVDQLAKTNIVLGAVVILLAAGLRYGGF